MLSYDRESIENHGSTEKEALSQPELKWGRSRGGEPREGNLKSSES